MGSAKLIAVFVVSSVMFYFVDCSCQFGNSTVDTDSNGVLDVYCDVPRARMRPGDALRGGCVECTCTRHTWSCCGIGYKSGLYVMMGCTKIRTTGCCFKFVRTSDRSTACSSIICPPPFIRK